MGGAIGPPTDATAPESNYWRDADVDHTQTIGGDIVKLLGGIYPPIPLGFRHPWLEQWLVEMVETISREIFTLE